MTVKKIWMAVICCCFFVLSGCWDLIEIDTVALPPTYGFGVNEDDPTRFRMFMEYYPIREEEQKLIYSVTQAQTVKEGINYLQKRIGGKIRNGYLNALVFEEKLAEKGLGYYLDYFWRDPSSSGSIVIAVVEGKVDKIFQSQIAQDYGIGIRLGDIIINNGPTSFQIPTQTLLEFYNKINNVGIDPYLPYLKTGAMEFGITGIALFKDDQMVGILDEELTQALLIVRDANSTGRLVYKDKLYKAGFNIRLDSVHIVPEWKDDQLKGNIAIKLTAFITEMAGQDHPLIDEETLNKVEKRISREIKDSIERLFDQLQHQYEVDTVGVGRLFQARYPKAFREIEWEKVYPNVKFSVKVITRVRIFGTTF